MHHDDRLLDAIEVSIINTPVGPIQGTVGPSDRRVLWAYVARFVGIVLGALGVGHLAGRMGGAGCSSQCPPPLDRGGRRGAIRAPASWCRAPARRPACSASRPWPRPDRPCSPAAHSSPAAFGATCAWVSAWRGSVPSSGRSPAGTAAVPGLRSVFTPLAVAWMIGAVAGVVWWVRGVEGRGLSREGLGRRPVAPATA